MIRSLAACLRATLNQALEQVRIIPNARTARAFLRSNSPVARTSCTPTLTGWRETESASRASTLRRSLADRPGQTRAPIHGRSIPSSFCVSRTLDSSSVTFKKWKRDMDQATQIEIIKIIDYVEDQATRHFAEDRSKSEPYETNISLGDEHPA